MRRAARVALLAAWLLVASTDVAAAHPLGNFTINHYAGLLLRPDALIVDYVLDMAEVPAFQERRAIATDPAGACARLAAGLRVELDGRAVPLAAEGVGLSFPPGQAGLDTLRLECGYRAELATAPGAPRLLAFRDGNYPDRIGWREVTARGEGVIVESTLPRDSASARLTAYPQEVLASPPDVRAAELRFTVAPTAPVAPAQATAPASIASREDDAFASLIARSGADAAGLLLAVLVALALGAGHALTPGHGKTVMAAYLVGATDGRAASFSRRSAGHAALLGLSVAIAHTAGVLGLGLVTLLASALVSSERLYPYLSAASALLVLGIGAALLRERLRRPDPRDHDHHAHEAPDGGELRSLAALGLAGGIVPSTSALVLLLGAISLGRIELGIVLIAAFGIGMAAALVGVGMALVLAGRAAARVLAGPRRAERVTALLPTVAALVLLALGVGMTARSIAALL